MWQMIGNKCVFNPYIVFLVADAIRTISVTPVTWFADLAITAELHWPIFR